MKHDDYARIEKAIYYMVEKVEDQPSLRRLADFLGLSEFHCHRVFKRWAGVTPKDFLQVLTLAKAKKLLAASHSLLDTSLELGLSGPSRLHDLFINLAAMTPGEYKKAGEGLSIYWDVFDSLFGKVALGVTDRGVCSLFFPESENERGVVREMKRLWPKAKLTRNASRVRREQDEICARIAGRKNGKIDLLLSGTPFQIRVWKALLSVPEGQVSTYAKIAESIGTPRAHRAVGSAIGANPIGYLIPCHRVIRSTGAVGDYHWGTDRKTALLSLECGRRLTEHGVDLSDKIPLS